MTTDNQSDNDHDEPISSIAGAAKTASTAARDTAQKYLDAAGMKVDLRDIEETIRDSPFYSLGIAAGAGFIIGGGLATSPGVALLALFGRKAARDTAANIGRQVLRRAR